MCGVAKLAHIFPVRVLNCYGSGSYAQVIDGIQWVADNHQENAVANMSLGGPSSASVNEAVNSAVKESNVVFCVAAGNDRRDACKFSPAGAADAITVGSIDRSDFRSSFPNYGECLTMFAPGSAIPSVVMGGGVESWYGTSMACK